MSESLHFNPDTGINIDSHVKHTELLREKLWYKSRVHLKIHEDCMEHQLQN